MDVLQRFTSAILLELAPKHSLMLITKTYYTFVALRYGISEKFNSERHLFLKKDPTDECSLIVANIPPYITPVSVRIFREMKLEIS